LNKKTPGGQSDSQKGENVEGIFESIITKNMAMLAVAAIAVMFFIGKIPIKSGKFLNQTGFWGNWGTFLLVIICGVGAFLPGVHNIPRENWGACVVFALVSSIVAHLGRAVLKPLLIRRLEGKKPVVKSDANDL
jgi:hypothetical protein